MQGEDDTRGLSKIMGFMRAVSIIVILMHFYWFCYGFFKNRGWTLDLINKILVNFQDTAGLFSEIVYTKLFALVLLALSCLGTKGVKARVEERSEGGVCALIECPIESNTTNW